MEWNHIESFLIKIIGHRLIVALPSITNISWRTKEDEIAGAGLSRLRLTDTTLWERARALMVRMDHEWAVHIIDPIRKGSIWKKNHRIVTHVGKIDEAFIAFYTFHISSTWESRFFFWLTKSYQLTTNRLPVDVWHRLASLRCLVSIEGSQHLFRDTRFDINSPRATAEGVKNKLMQLVRNRHIFCLTLYII